VLDDAGCPSHSRLIKRSETKDANTMQTANDNHTRTVQPLQIGETREVGSVRLHRFRSALTVTDLTMAGKRGRKVCELHVMSCSGRDDCALDALGDVLLTRSTIHAMIVDVEMFAEQNPRTIGVDDQVLRGVDVPPAGYRELRVMGEHILVTVDHTGFLVRDLDDKANEPCLMETGPKRNHKAFRAWAEKNLASLETMTFRELKTTLLHLGIDNHYWLAMD
jgi:hypothetical protein